MSVIHNTQNPESILKNKTMRFATMQLECPFVDWEHYYSRESSRFGNPNYGQSTETTILGEQVTVQLI